MLLEESKHARLQGIVGINLGKQFNADSCQIVYSDCRRGLLVSQSSEVQLEFVLYRSEAEFIRSYWG